MAVPLAEAKVYEDQIKREYLVFRTGTNEGLVKEFYESKGIPYETPKNEGAVT